MLKKLKSLFIIEDASSPNEKNETSPVPSNEEAQNDQEDFDIEMSEAKFDPNAQPDPRFVDILLKAVDSANREGFDYLEFKQSLQSLNSMGMDEPTKYKSAYAMAKTMGATSETLIESASSYIQVLKKEDTKFNDAMKNQMTVKIEGRKKDLEHLEKLIRDKQNTIEKLKKEIEEHQIQLDKKSKNIEAAASKVETTRKRFEHAYQIVHRQIQEDIDKIREYIQN